jgi:glucans biosynthesis protein
MNTTHNTTHAIAHTVPRSALVRFRSGRLAENARTLALLGAALFASNVHAFGFDDVARKAEKLAAASYKAPDKPLPKALKDLGYDQYRDIRYRTAKDLWANAGLSFEIAFFHVGYHFDQPVAIHEVDASGIHDFRYDPGLFDFGSTKIDPAALRDGGFAGFRVHYPLNTAGYKDEVVVFLGASFFRALGKGQVYGASARGLAIDTAVATGEEFPRFTEFWFARPAARERQLTFYALLDSPRASGAYQFVLRPGAATEIDVRARLYLRASVTKLGLAPLTSMFYYGENTPPPADDFRPEVHDSDGLSIHASNDEWIFRPLLDPKRLSVSSFQLTDPVGFGLTQRDRSFDHYEDLEAHYEKRPTVWIEPAQRWGAGRVELVLLPSPNEWNDNVVAYWVPAVLPASKQPLDFGYRMYWQKDVETRSPLSWVAQSRRGVGPGKADDGAIGFAVDFVGPALTKVPAETRVDAVVAPGDNAKVLEQRVERNDVTSGYRVVLRLHRIDAAKPLDLRMYLRTGDRVLSETWSYLLPPES